MGAGLTGWGFAALGGMCGFGTVGVEVTSHETDSEGSVAGGFGVARCRDSRIVRVRHHGVTWRNVTKR